MVKRMPKPLALLVGSLLCVAAWGVIFALFYLLAELMEPLPV